MKTIKKWEISNLKWNEYFLTGDIINEETFMYIAEVVAPEFSSEHFVQLGEASFSKYVRGEQLYFHATAMRTEDGKHIYLGDLPSFNECEV